MINKILWMLLFLFFLGCLGENEDEDQINIELEKVINNNIAFNESFSTIAFSSLHEKFPSYYKTQLNYKGHSGNDSIIIATLNTDYQKFKYDLFKKGFINEEEFNELKIDSLKEKSKPEQRQLVVGIKFKANKQLLIVDANTNKDFSDDKSMVFDENFRLHADDTSVINALPIYNFDYKHQYDDGSVINFKRSIIVYPHSNDLKFGYTEDEFIKKSRLVFKFKDYWKGILTHKNKKYDIAVQGGYSPYLTILVKPDSLKFSNSKSVYNDNFAYKIKDTLSLENDLFIIDSITNTNSKLIFKKIENYSVPFYGDKLGYHIADYELNTVNGQKTKISNVIKKAKKYTLLDFWGTWCLPCTKLTPKLKQFHQKNMENVNFISVAFDADINEVKQYTEKNDMNWHQAYVNNGSRTKNIISSLDIKAYPTFILLDENKKIIYRGIGEDAFNDIENILKNSL